MTSCGRGGRVWRRSASPFVAARRNRNTEPLAPQALYDLIDGFYTVVKGSLKLTIDNPETGEHFEKLFGPGDHFGERVLLRSALRTGLVIALEDTTVLWISQKDFTRFVRAFPFLENYFKEYIDQTFGGTEESFAPGSANHKHELETSP